MSGRDGEMKREVRRIATDGRTDDPSRLYAAASARVVAYLSATVGGALPMGFGRRQRT